MSALDLTDAKQHLNITTETDDAELQATIDAAEAAIAAIVGPIEPREVIETVYASGDLVLSTTPVIEVTSVTPTGATASDLTGIRTDAFAGVVTPSRPTRSSAGSPWPLNSELTVVYTAGRDVVPADLMQAIKEMVRHLWATQRGPTRRPGSADNSLSNTIPGAAYTLPIRVTQLLQPHSLPGFA